MPAGRRRHCNLFFQLVNARYELGAMMLTSNRGFTEWVTSLQSVVATEYLGSSTSIHLPRENLNQMKGGCAVPPNMKEYKRNVHHSLR